MTVSLCQVYIEAGANYPFSVHFQRLFCEELTRRVSPSALFISRYAEDFQLIFYMSAKAAISEPEIRGPTVFKKDKDVEFTIFLPFREEDTQGPDAYRRVLGLLMNAIVEVLKRLEIDPSNLLDDSQAIIERIVSDPKMIKKPVIRPRTTKRRR